MAIGATQFLPIGRKLISQLNNTVSAQQNQISEAQVETILKSSLPEVINLLKSLGVKVYENN